MSYEPADELCSNCRATLLVNVANRSDLVCPNCEDWRDMVGGAT